MSAPSNRATAGSRRDRQLHAFTSQSWTGTSPGAQGGRSGPRSPQDREAVNTSRSRVCSIEPRRGRAGARRRLAPGPRAGKGRHGWRSMRRTRSVSAASGTARWSTGRVGRRERASANDGAVGKPPPNPSGSDALSEYGATPDGRRDNVPGSAGRGFLRSNPKPFRARHCYRPGTSPGLIRGSAAHAVPAADNRPSGSWA
jgi:hypothetical protein